MMPIYLNTIFPVNVGGETREGGTDHSFALL